MSESKSDAGVRASLILGINSAYHQDSACVVRDGVVVAAAEEERFNRIKGGKEADVDNTLILPFQAIDSVLKAAGVRISDVDLIATSFSLSRRNQARALWESCPPVLKGRYETPEGDQAFMGLMRLMPDVLAARYGLPAEDIRNRFRWVPHHASHAASAYYASPFDEAVGLVIDGIGETDTTTIFDCTADGVKLIETIDYPHSLGFIWEVVTDFLGFRGNHDECKIMGLAAYGDPSVYRDAIGGIIQVDESGIFRTNIDPGVLSGDYSQLESLFNTRRRLPYEPLAWEGSNRRHANLAAALQEKTNDIFMRLAMRARAMTGRRYLVMAGGVTLNCVGNGLIAEHAGFDDVFVQPAAGDAGTAVGAALQTYHDMGGIRPEGLSAMPNPFLGPAFTDDEIERALIQHRLNYERVADPVETAAGLLADGQVVGWFQGAMEFGPRALGNRSLLANPTLPGVRHTLNLHIKHREGFRPFCPSVLAEHASEWFVHERPLCMAGRCMLATYLIRPEKQDMVPAIIHLDGSSRAQFVHREDNPLFHDLISAFYRRTGIPMLLNTSFNDREPIVCTPADACQTWLKTRFDAMFLGPFLVTGLKPWERKPQLTTFEIESQNFDAGPSIRGRG